MKKINDGHYIELMDRIYLQISSIECNLYNHPLTKKIKKVRKLIKKAGMSLSEAYQIVGHKSFENKELSRFEIFAKLILNPFLSF